MELIIASESIDAGGGVVAAEDVIVVGSACDEDPLGDVLPSPGDVISELEGFDGVGSAAPAGSPEGLKEAIKGELIAVGEGEDQVVLLALEELEVRGFKIEEVNLIEAVVKVQLRDGVMAETTTKEIGIAAIAAIECIIAGTTPEGVITRAGEEEIVSLAAAEDVMAMAGIEGVVTSFSN